MLVNYESRRKARLYGQLDDLRDEVPDKFIDEMVYSANMQNNYVRENYGQDLQSFSHGEAYLQIMQQGIRARCTYLLDEPEAALSPSRQLALLHFIHEHLAGHQSQFIIATHAPILMAYPGAKIYEITSEGTVGTALDDTEHCSITRGFLNAPEA